VATLSYSWVPTLLREEVFASGKWYYQDVIEYDVELVRQTYDYCSFDILQLESIVHHECFQDLDLNISDTGTVYLWRFSKSQLDGDRFIETTASASISTYFLARDHIETYAGRKDITWFDPPRGA